MYTHNYVLSMFGTIQPSTFYAFVVDAVDAGTLTWAAISLLRSTLPAVVRQEMRAGNPGAYWYTRALVRLVVDQ